MSIGDLTKRIIAYWWVILITAAAITLLLFPWSNQNQYIGSITVGVNFNNPQLSNLPFSPYGYVDSFESLSTYLVSRYSAVDVQQTINETAGLGVTTLKAGNPFYDVKTQTAGFVNLTYSTPNKEQAEKFNSAVKVAYTNIVKEWNISRPVEYQISPMNSFSESVVQVQKPIQFQLLPIVSGALIGVILILILPMPSKRNSKKAA